MAENDVRVVIDSAREPWTVEPAFPARRGPMVLRYRHEMGYELAAVAPRPMHELSDRELAGLLEDARRRPPKVADAA